MKLSLRKRSEVSSATTAQSLWLVVGGSLAFALTALAADPSWWSSPGTGSQPAVMAEQVVTNNGVVTTNYVPNPYAVVTQGQLKQFTARAVDELNSYLPGGAGTNLNTMVSNWAQDYATNDYSSATNAYAPYKPSDFTALNVGQLKYIGNLVWSQLVAGGYTNAAPSWLARNTNSDNAAAVLGQLKEVFNFDLSSMGNTVTGVAATLNDDGSVTLTWGLPDGSNGNPISIAGIDAAGNVTILDAISGDLTTFTIPASQLQNLGFSLLGVSNATGSLLNATLLAGATGTPKPKPPSGLTGYADDSERMNLSWTAPTGAAGSYFIERENVASGTWSALSTTSNTTYQDTSYGAGGYHYRVSTIANTGTSTPSGEYPSTQYAVVDLGANSSADFVNNSGQIVLNARSTTPVFWDKGSTTNIADPTGNYIFSGDDLRYGNDGVTGLNNNGVVTGTCGETNPPDLTLCTAFTWSKADGFQSLSGTIFSISSLPLPDPGTDSLWQLTQKISGLGINDNKTVIGTQYDTIESIDEIDVDSFTYAEASAGLKITSSGTYSKLDNYIITLINPSNSLGVGPQETTITPVAINNNEIVIGSYNTWQTNTGTWTSLDPHTYDSNGNVIGDGPPTPLASGGMIWDGSLHPINGSLAAINNNNQIIGNSEDEDGQMAMWQGSPDPQNPNQTDYNPIYLPGGPNGAAEFGNPVAINTATVTLTGTNGQSTTVPATQVITWNRIWTMSPPTGTSTTGTFGLPQGINDALPVGAGWSGVTAHAINDSGAIVGTASYTPTGTADPIPAGQHGVMLLPFKLVNKADPYQGSAVIGTPSHNDQDTPIDLVSTNNSPDINSVAWIAAGDASAGNAPRMPQLQATLAAPSGTTVWWKLSVINHSQMNPSQPYRDFDTFPSGFSLSSAQIQELTNVTEWAGYSGPVGGMVGYSDDIAIPYPESSQDNGVENGWVPVPAGTPWNIYQDPDWLTAVAAGFFGGDAELSFKITTNDGNTIILPEQDFYFRIAGENPNPTVCENYIDQQYNGGQPASSPQRWTGLSYTATNTPPTVPGYWFAYAMAKEETDGDGGNRPYYNNFMDNGGQLSSKGRPWPGHEGRPDWNNDGIPDPTRGSGGYGLFQLTFDSTDATFIMPRDWIWNWQTNVREVLPILQQKLGYTQGYLNYIHANNSSFTDPSSLNTTADATTFNFWESSVITLNNAGSVIVGPKGHRRVGAWSFTPGSGGASGTWTYVPNDQQYLKAVAIKGVENHP